MRGQRFGSRTRSYSGSFNSGRSNNFSRRRSPNRGFSRDAYIDERRYISAPVQPQTTNAMYSTDITFADFALNPALKNNIANNNYKTPTQIQAQTIPQILQGKDVLALATTGSGKTAAFLIPMINKVIQNPAEKCLIIAPTRELVSQIQMELRKFSFGLNIRDVVIIGGASMRDQINVLRKNPQFVIATPGRLLDVYERRCIDLEGFNNVVLDEVDRMLDMGFVKDIRYVISKLSLNKQVLFFSATITRDAEQIANSILVNPIRVQAETQSASKNVEQNIVRVGMQKNKMDVLHDLLINKEFQKVLVFSRTKHGADDINDELINRGFKSAALHGNKSMRERTKVLSMFKTNSITILVATDVASRGIDVPDITHVINYDEPATFEDYIHRIGRTGRIGKKGVALTFVR